MSTAVLRFVVGFSVVACTTLACGDAPEDASGNDASAGGDASGGGDASTGNDASTGGENGSSSGNGSSSSSGSPAACDEASDCPAATQCRSYVCHEGACVANDETDGTVCSVGGDVCTKSACQSGICEVGPGSRCASITHFSRSQPTVAPGESVVLSWQIEDAVSCVLTSDANGTLAVDPTEVGEVALTLNRRVDDFTLSCRGEDDTPVEDTLRVHSSDADWAQIATSGLGSSCAIKTDGSLYCWGVNYRGQLGGHPANYSHFPVREHSFANDWAKVSMLDNHVCAIKHDGRLFCWGANPWGQVGDGSSTDRLVPVQEHSHASDWTQVSAGATHTCAVKADGRLYCWGLGNNGRLGNGSLDGSRVPIQEQSHATDWVQVTAGGDGTCGLKTDGRLFCWGNNFYGQLGNESPSYGTTVPAQESSLATDWAQVSMSYYHTCAVKTDGRLFCWGFGEHGRLGNDATSHSRIPVQEHSAATDWAQVSAAFSHTCALKTDGRLFCWGEGGRLASGSDATSLVPVQEAMQRSDWTSVAAGQGCALRQGIVFCWHRRDGLEDVGANVFVPLLVARPLLPAL